MNHSITTLFAKDEQATQLIGSALAQLCEQFLVDAVNSIERGIIITLDGQLGTGKSTLVRACLRELGVQGAIKSPTYTLLEPYEIQSNSISRELKIAHLDLYRLVEPEELDYIGGRELEQSYNLVFIEWPDKGQGYIPSVDIKIELNHKDTGREITFSSSNSSIEKMIKSIKFN